MASRQFLSPIRLYLFAASLLVSIVVLLNTSGNSFRPPIIALWMLSALLWALTFTPREWNIFVGLYRLFNADWWIPWRSYWWAYLAFALIMFAGISFRITELERMPAEILNDPYLNLLDAYEFSQGIDQPVYFNYNNGREPLSFWLMALLATVPGFGFDFYTLKLSTALASVLALPLTLCLGIEFMGESRRKAGVIMGLLLASMFAGSYWETVVSRSGDLHSWVSVFALLVSVLLIRAVRHNRRVDFIMVGLALGFALYVYKSTILLPVAVGAAVLAAMALRPISTLERRRYAANLCVTFIIALAISLPLIQYMLEYPGEYFRRAHQLIHDPATTIDSEAEYRWQIVSNVLSVIQKHLGMYNWRGDPNLERNFPGAPALDAITGTLLILGMLAVAAKLLKSRDPVLWMLPIILLISHLPSVLVVAPDATSQVPSMTRTLVALPQVYLIAAVALYQVMRQFLRTFNRPVGLILATLIGVAVAFLAYQHNHKFYFEDYNIHLTQRTLPTSDGGKILRGFVNGGGAIGNSFIIQGGDSGEARFIAAAAGVLDYPNVIYNASDISQALGQAIKRELYPLDPNRDLLFLYSPQNGETTALLDSFFSEGHLIVVPTYNPNHNYATYRVPGLGR